MTFYTNSINFANLTAKSTPIGADKLLLADSANNFAPSQVLISALFANAPAITTPSVAFSPSTGGVVGTIAADNAAAGKVGEFISSQILQASAVSFTSATTKNLVSISLTAGDWDVWGNVTFTAAAGTIISEMVVGISTVTVSFPDNSLINILTITFPAASTQALMAPLQRINISTTTTVYLAAIVDFTVSTCTGSGGIYARRAR